MPYRRIAKAIDEYSRRVFVVILLLLAVGSGSYVWWNTTRFEEFVECQARWGSDLREYTESADRANAEERAVDRSETTAVNRLVQELVDDEVDDEIAIERWRDAVQAAQERRREIETDRKANPLPEPPLEVCDSGAVEGDRGRVPVADLFD